MTRESRRRGAPSPALGLLGSIILGCALVVFCFLWFTSYLIWWFWVAALLASVAAALAFGGRQPGRLLVTWAAYFALTVAAQYVFTSLLIAPHLN